jgi:release factor glutamine methyltransferase
MAQTATITKPSIAELLQHAEQQLRAFDTAKLDAELLLCHVAKLTRTTLHAHPEQILSEEVIHTYQALIEQRHAEQPIAYLTGNKEFWSIKFKVNENILIPRPETECLVEEVLKHIPKNEKYKIADLGTGCGAIAISIAKERPQSHITAIDISPDALNIAKENASHLGIKNISFVQSDWYENTNDCFDIIVSNPPYIKQDDEHLTQGGIQHEPQLALASGPDGLNAIKHIINNASEHLNNKAWILLEHGCDQGNEVRTLLYEHGFSDPDTRKDYSGHERVSFGKSRI